MAWIELLLSAVGGGAVALAGAAWLFRQWIKHRLEKELETHKTQLASRSEVLKTELSIYAHEQNVGLTRIDAQRSEAILAIWAILGEWHEVFLDLTAPNRRLDQDLPRAIPQYQEWARKLMDASDRLSIEVRNRAIFFGQAAYEPIARCGSSISEVTNDFYASSYEEVDVAAITDAPAFLGCVREARKRLRASAEASVNELRCALVHEFRVLMKAEKAPVSASVMCNE